MNRDVESSPLPVSQRASRANIIMDEEIMTILTSELREAVERAGDQPVEITDPQTNTHYVLLREDVYRRMREMLDEDEDRREKDAWAKLGRKARSEWARENPY